MHILVVEDNPAHRGLAAVILINEGYQVTSVATGIAALKFLSEQDCDLMFMDVQMPEMDGLPTTSLIRQYGRGVVSLPACRNCKILSPGSQPGLREDISGSSP